MADPRRPCAVDIETNSGTITEIGFGYPEVAIVVPFMSRNKESGNYWDTIEEEIMAWDWVRDTFDAYTAPYSRMVYTT